MLRIERLAYRRVTELFTLDIDEDLARDITENINKWLVKGEEKVEVTIKILEDVVNQVGAENVDWERDLIFTHSLNHDPLYTTTESLYNYLAEWIDDEIWNCSAGETDGETSDWYDTVITLKDQAAAE